ncbi:MAG: nucleoside 2-deoxyribosyltransferase domain-containing protein [Bacteroidota bacterium]
MKYENKVYLSGGLGSNWQRKVIEELGKDFIMYNPREHGLDKPKEYTAWDLYHIKICDLVFAYMETDNQSGYGLTLEIGYAKALEKTIILVDERSKADATFESIFHIVRESASVSFDNLDSGIEYLKSFK